MMKNSIIALSLTALMLPGTCLAAETDKSVTISFDANETTGYSWHGFVLGGDCVVLDSEDGSYVMDDNPDQMDGVGGTTYFTLTPVEPGEGIVTFSYARPWEGEPIDQTVLYVEVDGDLNIFASDVTEGGMISGTVLDVDEQQSIVVIESEMFGEINAIFPDAMQLPVPDEEICIYTNGTMTLSLPPMVNVLAWSSIPDEAARDAEQEAIEFETEMI